MGWIDLHFVQNIHYHEIVIRNIDENIISKDKDRRIRNELTRELETEIRICEEKINDANANGDQQEKYKLMRIKDKLTAEKHRVQLNSNFI